MPRLVELESDQALPPALHIRLGDVVAVPASGCILEAEDGAVEMIGIFNRAIESQGEAIAPEGGPNLVLLRGRSTGATPVQLVIGDPFSAPRRMPMRITVAGAGQS
jgi:hypothetical protein